MDAVAGRIIKLVTDTLIAKIKREVRYLIDYNTNIRNLENERDGIQQSIDRIQVEVNAAEKNGQIVFPDVKKWLTEAPKMKEKTDRFLEGTMDLGCSGGWCLDLVSRYRLSKKAVSMKKDLDTLKEGREFERIAHRARPPEFGVMSSADDFQAFTSRAIVFEAIMGALIDDHVNMVGIYGLGGVGKTTMAKEIGKRLKVNGRFDEVVMAVVSQNVVVRNIQTQLADHLGLKLEKETEEGRAGKLWIRLNNGKKNLVILDDLWSKLEIHKIGIPIAGHDKGCKVLLTSRDQRVFQDMNVGENFLLGVLNDEEALHLFHNKMGNFASEIRESVVEEVCKECWGLPVAIVAVAKALKGKRNAIWYEASAQLRDSMLKDIVGVAPMVNSSLKLSYDLLRPKDAKECLLICCLFPEDVEISIEDLARYGMAMGVLQNVFTLEDARNRVRMLVDILRTSSLLLDGRGENRFKIHDVIRDVAITIATDEKAFLVRHGAHLKQWPEKDAHEGCTVISLRSPNIGRLPDGLKCPQLHTLVLECPNAENPDSFFSGMTQLRLLHIKAMDLRRLPSSVGSLNSLCMLCLEDCRLGDISLIGKNLKSLEMLSLVSSGIMELPSELKQVTHLRLLDLRRCSGLHVIPPNVISSLTYLEELLISEMFDKWEVESTNRSGTNASLAELNSLARLVVLEICIRPSLLSDNLRIFNQLIRYKVTIGDAHIFMPYMSDKSTNKSLRISDFRMRDDIKVLLEKAEYLELVNLKGIVNVLHKQQFSDLKYLWVKSCGDLKYLFGEEAWFFKLRELRIDVCGALKYLFPPSTARFLKQLQRLEVSSCKEVEEIIGSQGNSDKDDASNIIIFDQLKYLSLRDLRNFKSFYPNINKTPDMKATTSNLAQYLFNEKVAFPALEELIIKELQNKQIWDDTAGEVENSFCNLQVLRVWHCDDLVNVIPSSMKPRLHQLKKLSIGECNSMVSVVEEGIFPSAQAGAAIEFVLGVSELYLKGLKSLISAGLENEEYRGACSNLTILNVIKCPQLKNAVLSSSIATKLVHLQELEIFDCEGIEEVVAMEKAGEEYQEAKNHLIVFSALKRLRLHMLPSFRTFCRSIPKKEYAKYEEPLFNHQVSLPELEKCSVSGVKSNVIFGGHFPLHSFDKLIELKIFSCDNLSTVVPPDLLPRLKSLKVVEIEGCDILRNLFSPSVAAAFVQLQLLKVCSCKGMEEIVSNEEKERVMIGEIALTGLEDIVLEDLPNLKSFCSGNYAFKLPSLRKLVLSGCRNIQNFISGKVSMPKKDVIDGNGNQLRDLNEYARQQAAEASQLWNSLHANEDDGGKHNVKEEENNDVPR